MAQRTVRQAKEWLDAHAVDLKPVAFAQFQREIQAAEGEHVANATRAVDTEAAAFAEEHQELLTDGCGIRDDYEQLAKDAVTGRLSAKEYRERLDKVNQEVPDYSSRAERLAQKIKHRGNHQVRSGGLHRQAVREDTSPTEAGLLILSLAKWLDT